MFKDSFWYPSADAKGVLLLCVVVMAILHESAIFGLLDSSVLVFGWLPIQLAYDIVYTTVAVGLAAVVYRMAPRPPADLDPIAGNRSEEED